MREFREIRLDLGADGTGDAASPYISLARTQLGVLQNQMRLGGLQQGSLTKTLPDGTRIMVSSFFGRNTVRIVATAAVIGAITAAVVAPSESLAAPPTTAPAPGPGTRVVGSMQDSVNFTPIATIWNGQAAKVLPIPSYASGIGSEAVALSVDGSVAVGYYADPSTGWDHSFVWRGGSVVDSIRYTDGNDTQASSVSQDGSVVVGVDVNTVYVPGSTASQAHRGWRWTRATGAQVLPDLGMGIEFGPKVGYNAYRYLVISPSGRYIVGSVVTGGASGSTRPNALAVWTNSGTTLTLVPGGANSIAAAVDDSGNILAYPNDAYTGVNSPEAITSFIINAFTGAQRAVGTGLVFDGGNKAAVGSYGGGLANGGAWYLAPSGQTLLPSDIYPYGYAYGVARDGAVVTGSVFDPPNNADYPVIWHGGQLRYLTLPFGYAQGRALDASDQIKP